MISTILFSDERKDKKDMKYNQLTPEERYTISAYRKAGLSVNQMAK